MIALARLTMIGLLLTAGFAQAQTLTWTGAAGNGLWDTTSNNWGGTWNNSGAATAVFDGTGNGTSISLVSTTINLNALKFTANGYTISGTGVLSFNGINPEIDVSTGFSATFTNSNGFTTTADNLTIANGGTIRFDVPNATISAPNHSIIIGPNTTVVDLNSGNFTGSPFGSTTKLALGLAGTFIAGGGGTGFGAFITLPALTGGSTSKFLIGATGTNNSGLTLNVANSTSDTFDGSIDYVGGSLPANQANRYTLTLNTTPNTGFSTVTFTSNNKFSGSVLIGKGTTFVLGHAAAMGIAGTSSTLTVSDGATLDLNGNSPTSSFASASVAGTGASSAGALINSSATPATISFQVNLSPLTSTSLGGAGNLILSGRVSNSGQLNKIGNGTLTLSRDGTVGSNRNNYGTSRIDAGILLLGAPQALPSAGTVQLNGGTLQSGSPSGFSSTAGPLQLSASSTISLGGGLHQLTFGGLTGTPTGTLTITGWQGNLGQSGIAGELIFSGLGTQPNTDFAAFLSNVQFSGANLGDARFIANGANWELVPVPEPCLGLLGACTMGWFFRQLRCRIARVL
jgi:hypothetical protein